MLSALVPCDFFCFSQNITVNNIRASVSFFLHVRFNTAIQCSARHMSIYMHDLTHREFTYLLMRRKE
jgi:hypothetical protein